MTAITAELILILISINKKEIFLHRHRFQSAQRVPMVQKQRSSEYMSPFQWFERFEPLEPFERFEQFEPLEPLEPFEPFERFERFEPLEPLEPFEPFERYMSTSLYRPKQSS